MMKALRIAAISLCITLLVLPVLAIPFFGSGATRDENRYLADYPVLADEDEGLNPDFDTEFEAWLCDHFAFRKPVIAANALLNYRLLHYSVSEQVIAGKGDWLYFADTMPDYTGEGRLTDEELAEITRNLSLLREALERFDAVLYVAIVPNKSTIYPQFMPGRYAMRGDGGNIERLRTACEDLDIAWIDLEMPLREAAAGELPVYYRTDTHWNALGAAVAAREILNAMGREGESYAVTTEAVFSEGDLSRLMGAAGRLTETVPVVAPGHPLPEGDFSKHRMTCPGPGEGDLLIYRDSFGTAVGPWLAQAYGETESRWEFPLDGTRPCDDALLLICERNLREYLLEPPLIDDVGLETDEDDGLDDSEDEEDFDDLDALLSLDWEEVDEESEDFDESDGDSEDLDEDEPDDFDEFDDDPRALLDLDWEEVDEEAEDFDDETGPDDPDMSPGDAAEGRQDDGI